MKLEIMAIIRENRAKHRRHKDPENLDVIKKITHCWWNPINTKSLLPYLNSGEQQQMLGSAREKKLDEAKAEAKAKGEKYDSDSD
jgi:hypothetical protein